jgi:hypothetical protein
MESSSLSAVVRATEALCRLGLQSSPAHIAVIDGSGKVMLVNAAWQAFAKANGATGENLISIGMNYLDICRKAAPDAEAAAAYAGVAGVLDGSLRDFEMTYSCDGPSGPRRYQMNVAPLDAQRHAGAIVSHTDMTEREKEFMPSRELEANLRNAFAELTAFDARTALLRRKPNAEDNHRSQAEHDVSAEAAINAYYLAFDMTDIARSKSFVLQHSTRLLAEMLIDWAKTTSELPFKAEP